VVEGRRRHEPVGQLEVAVVEALLEEPARSIANGRSCGAVASAVPVGRSLPGWRIVCWVVPEPSQKRSRLLLAWPSRGHAKPLELCADDLAPERGFGRSSRAT
jgi:hypothetical protein